MLPGARRFNTLIGTHGVSHIIEGENLMKVCIRSVIVLSMVLSMLSGCGSAESPSLPTSPSQSDTASKATIPGVATRAVQERAPLPTPTVPVGPVALGTETQVGRYTVMLHRAEKKEWINTGLFEDPTREQRLFLDISIRNDGPETARNIWQKENRFAIVSVDGTVLNSEWYDVEDGGNDAAIGLLPETLQGDCGGDPARAARDVMLLSDLEQGMVARGWINFKLTPGLDMDGLVLRVQFRDTPAGAFQLEGTPNPRPLTWTTTPNEPEPEITFGPVIISTVKAGPVAPAKKLLGWETCPIATRTVTVHVKNTDSRTTTFGNLPIAFDAEGHTYLATSHQSIDLGPQEEADVTFTFLAIIGLEQAPVALMLNLGAGTVDGRRIRISE